MICSHSRNHLRENLQVKKPWFFTCFFSVNCFLWPIQWLCNLRNAQRFYLFDMKRMERDIFIYTITYAHEGFCRNFFGSRKWSWTLVSWTYRVGAPRSETSVGLEHIRPNVMFSLFNYHFARFSAWFGFRLLKIPEVKSWKRSTSGMSKHWLHPLVHCVVICCLQFSVGFKFPHTFILYHTLKSSLDVALVSCLFLAC